ncbi:MAG: hypothetical protein ABIT37_11705 [Luteolibacter sp.]
MKNIHAIGLVAASVAVTFAIEESRMTSLRLRAITAATAVAATPSATASATAAEEPLAPVRTKGRTEVNPAKTAAESESADESMAKTVRKMWDNPAGKSMMNQGAKMAVAMMYEDFIDGLHLSKEEGDYFKNLLGKEISDQQEVGMKLMSATPEERKALTEELKKRGTDSEAEIKKFLNNDEDIKAYNDYKSHLPEHQQLDGIRGAMTGGGVPMDAATEAKLVDAMYRARTETKAPDLSGAAGMEELSKGNIVETYEKSWEAQQAALGSETSKFLSTAQQTALADYQKQAKEMQLMGLKMAEKMMSGKKDGGK